MLQPSQFYIDMFKQSMRHYKLKHIKRAVSIRATLGKAAAMGYLRNQGLSNDNEVKRLFVLAVQLNATKGI